MKKILKYLVPISLVAYWLYDSNNRIKTSYYRINNPKLPASFKGYKLAIVADLHNKDWRGQLLKRLAKEEPDLILIPGDIVNRRKPNLELIYTFIEAAGQIAPIYYVPGNHESALVNFPDLFTGLQVRGVNLLLDRGVYLEKEGEEIFLFGLVDPRFSTKSLPQRLQELKEPTKYQILLSHRPEYFATYVANEIDLVFAGHAHGGQIRLPLIGGLVAPGQGLFPKYTKGKYSTYETDMVVSRGLWSGLFPLRVNNYPELVLVTLDQ